MGGLENTLRLRIITPSEVVSDEYVDAVTAPTKEGEITVLPNHANLFTALKERLLKIRVKKDENYFAIGGGFMETDGVEINILVSRAHGQKEIDEQLTQKAIKDAEKIIEESKDEIKIQEARTLLRRSLVDMKLIRKRKKTSVV